MQKQLLVVDDDPLFIDLVRDFFSVEDIEIISAPDANLALSLLETARPALIVSDYDMPGMDGVEFRSRLLQNERTRDIPFVFLTGSSDKALIQYAHQNHVRVLSKSMLIRELTTLSEALK